MDAAAPLNTNTAEVVAVQGRAGSSFPWTVEQRITLLVVGLDVRNRAPTRTLDRDAAELLHTKFLAEYPDCGKQTLRISNCFTSWPACAWHLGVA